MPILILTVLLALIFILSALLLWGLLRLFGRTVRFRSLAGRFLIAFCIAVPVFVFLVTPVLFSELLSRASSRPQDRIPADPPDRTDIEFFPVSFPSRDSLTIRGWYLPGTEKPACIMGHGLFRSRNEMLERGCRLNRLGYPVLLFDFRSHGISDPGPVTLGVRERLDVLGACDYLKREKGHSKPVYCGVSMGAVAGLLAAADSGQPIRAVIADSPYDDLRRSVGKHVGMLLGLPEFPFADIFLWRLERNGSFNADSFRPVDQIGNLESTPVLFIFGSKDKRMDRPVAENLFAAALPGHKAIHFFPGAGHGAAYITDPDRYISLIDQLIYSLE